MNLSLKEKKKKRETSVQRDLYIFFLVFWIIIKLREGLLHLLLVI
jgi:hypothetical protein